MCNFQECTILSRTRTNPGLYLIGMAVNSTLLCIHRDPAQLSLLERSGFELVTATNGHDGLRLFMSQPVDAIVLDYHLGLLDGGVVAAEMKKVKPTIPIVMLAHDRDLPVSALKVVDALVAKCDGFELLVATVTSLLKAKPESEPPRKGPPKEEVPTLRRPPGSARSRMGRQTSLNGEFLISEKDAPFSESLWKSIRNGTVRF
jgi:DNA-binding response OmpR family regulator